MTLAEFRDWLVGYARRFSTPGRPAPHQWRRILREAANVERKLRETWFLVDFDRAGTLVVTPLSFSRLG